MCSYYLQIVLVAISMVKFLLLSCVFYICNLGEFRKHSIIYLVYVAVFPILRMYFLACVSKWEFGVGSPFAFVVITFYYLKLYLITSQYFNSVFIHFKHSLYSISLKKAPPLGSEPIRHFE